MKQFKSAFKLIALFCAVGGASLCTSDKLDESVMAGRNMYNINCEGK